MSEPSLVIVVLEDDHHKMLIYRHLRGCGLGARRMRILRSPFGRGSGEQWVQQRFVVETRVYRRRQAQTALIVMLDADKGTVQDRLAQLDQALKESGKPVIDRHERIARLVPRRNVETWILNLNGQTVDEDTDYKRATRDWDHLIPDAAETLNRLIRSGAEPPDECVDSLRRGVIELKRLDL